MATITGFIERIKFRNEENGYTVMSVTDQSDGEEVIMVGNLAYAAEGDMIEGPMGRPRGGNKSYG